MDLSIKCCCIYVPLLIFLGLLDKITIYLIQNQRMHISQTAIDQHRQSIQQRINKLQAKLKAGHKSNKQNKLNKTMNIQRVNQTIDVIGIQTKNKQSLARRSYLNDQQMYQRGSKQFQQNQNFLNTSNSNLMKTVPIRKPYNLENDDKKVTKNHQYSQMVKAMQQIIQNQKNLEKEVRQLKKNYQKVISPEKRQLYKLSATQKLKQLVHQQSYQSKITRKDHTILIKQLESISNKYKLQDFDEIDAQKLANTNYNYEKLFFAGKSADKNKQIINNSAKKQYDNCGKSVNKQYGRLRSNNLRTFKELVSIVKEQQNNNKVLYASNYAKAKIWQQVKKRMKQSQNQYKDTFHKNNKHLQQHLIRTSELQKKLKSTLVDKIYDFANKCIYK